MNLAPTSHPSEDRSHRRNTWWLWAGGIATVLFTGFELASLRLSGDQFVWAILPAFSGVLIACWLLSRGRRAAAAVVLILTIGVQSILISLTQSGLGLPNLITSSALISGISIAGLPRKYTGRVVLAGLIVSILSFSIDLFGNPSRPIAEPSQGQWIFSLMILVLFLISFAREFLFLDLRTKIVTGILSTGGVALLVLVIFALYQTRDITGSLAQRLDTSVNQLAEERLLNIALTNANQIDKEFQDISEEVTALAQVWVSLQQQNDVLNRTPYWDAHQRLVQLDAGQYGNSATDPSSVFIPAGTPVDDDLIKNLNTSAHLDFSAPGILSAHPSMLALYAIDTKGVTRYYPNIDLASILPPDFDATARPYFTISLPLFNPQRLPRWTIPYADATGGGLVVTVAAPVYEENEFIGVVAADMQLAQITELIGSIRVEKTGFAFMIDDAGRILSMPPAGYNVFDIKPQAVTTDDFSKYTILGLGTEELKSVTKRMVAGGHGLMVVDAGGVDTYISFFPIRTNGYSIALVVPVAESQAAIVEARTETQEQLRGTTRLAAVLLIILLGLAIVVSLGLGKVIAAPIQSLTQAASRISAGDLSVQAPATTNDEIGTLASAFNTMTSRLRETLDELEHRVEERTAELRSANEKNERRARQFEAIASIARAISSTSDLDTLLSQISTVIHREFGFYHVGIFLLDTAKEYAVLSAANSEGGKIMLARGHRLKVGETGMVGYVTGTGKPRVALDTGADAVFFNNPDLSETRSELTLPLRAGEEIIGALDVQSTEPNAFVQEDIDILSTLADQVSIAIQNARQFEETRKALNEAEVLSRQFVHTGWQEFTKTRNLLGIRHTGARASLIHKRNRKEKAEDLLDPSQLRTNGRGVSLSLPIKLHGEVIGAVDVRSPDNRPWDQDELDIVTAIIERAAIAMENARLLAESQKRAAKERIISEISSKISMQSEINDLLKTAAQELGRRLPDAEIAIQFNKDTE